MDGSMTVTTQQCSQLMQAKRANPDKVRRHYVQDLKAFLHARKSRGDRLVLQGDFNEVIGVTVDGMSGICSQLKSVDVIHHFHGLPQGHFATWIDGKTTVDYVMVDEELLPSVVSCGYMPFMEHVQGNHRAMYVDFDTSMLFGAENSQLAPYAR